MPQDRALLTAMFNAAVASADPTRALGAHLPPRPKGRCVVVGAGKGAAQMAAAFEALWPHPLSGVVVTRHGAGVPCQRIRVMEAAHPVPDEAGLAASAALFKAVAGLGPDDLVVALISGGGSALLPAPAAGLTLADEIALNTELLRSGAPIGVMNALRGRISRIKGGRLALAAHPAQVVSLIVSDVAGDDPAQVASGPTVAGQVPDDPLALARDYGIALPPRIAAFMADAATTLAPSPDDPRFAGHRVTLIASARQALLAAADVARAAGLPAHILSDALTGEAQSTGQILAAIATASARGQGAFTAPCVLLSGGETTVRLPDSLQPHARGGRNTTCALAMADGIAGTPITALLADTDGIDGHGDHAGGFVDGTSAARLRQLGLPPASALASHDSAGALAQIDDLFITGPTGTNVNDFRAIVIR